MKITINEENINDEQKLSGNNKYNDMMMELYVYPSMARRHMKVKKRLEDIFDDLEVNHNHSWIEEIRRRNKYTLGRKAFFYRGSDITYTEFFDRVNTVAKSLKKIGIEPGDEVAMCVSNCPEAMYFLGAINDIGAKANIFGKHFDGEYIKEIINGCSKKILIVTDDVYRDISDYTISDFITPIDVEYKVAISLTDSLGKNYSVEPSLKRDDEKYNLVNYVYSAKSFDNSVISFSEFLDLGKKYPHDVRHKVGLHDDFIITYTSGTTNNRRPKGIVHTNNSLISMARFHDKDLSRLPDTKYIRSLAHIPLHSNTDLITTISDTLSQCGTVALEPIYDPEFFARSLLINKPNFVPATTSFWIRAMKDFDATPEFFNEKLPFLYLPTTVGEAVSKGEEKFINKVLKSVDAGKDKLKIMTAPLSLGAGSVEQGGIYFRLYKSLFDKLYDSKTKCGLVPFQLATPAILREDGTECFYGEIGRLVSNSRCTMREYKNNPLATEEFFITDAYGRNWTDSKLWAYIDTFGNVHIKGRMGDELELSNGDRLPLFEINDAILSDSKNILSCETVIVEDEGGNKTPVAHVELQPERKKSKIKILESLANRVDRFCGSKVTDLLLVDTRRYTDSFPLTGCGKRNVEALKQEGTTYGVKLSDYSYRIKKNRPKMKIKK